MIELESSRVVYRNPRPQVRARHAWHPSLVHLDGPRWLCSFDLGQAPESHDYATYVSRSSDDGSTWTPPERLLPVEPPPRATHSLRVGRLADGRLLAMGPRFLRDDPEAGLINHPGLGYTDMELVTSTSRDAGETWEPARVVTASVAGPFETCHAPLQLRSGRLLWPTSTWMDWEGGTPERMRAIALVSDDGGATWGAHLEVLDQWDRGVVTWESSVAELDDGRLLATVWSYSVADGRSEPSLALFAEHGADRFSSPVRTGISAQTMKIASLGGDRVLAVYRRDDRPGLWAALADVAGGRWTTLDVVALWGAQSSGMAGGDSAGQALSALQFGYPSLSVEAAHPDRGDDSRRVSVAFWCRNDDVNEIRLLRLAVRGGSDART